MWRPTWISNKKLFPHIIHLSYSMVRYYSTIYDSYGTHNVTKWQSILRRSIKSFVPYKLYSRVQIYSYKIHVNEYWFPFAVQSLSEELNHQHLKIVTKTFCLQHPSPTSIENILWDFCSSFSENRNQFSIVGIFELWQKLIETILVINDFVSSFSFSVSAQSDQSKNKKKHLLI